MRGLVLSVPMPLVRALFVALPLALIVWVWRQRADRTVKAWAVAALVLQVLIYLVL